MFRYINLVSRNVMLFIYLFMCFQETYLMKHMSKHTVVEHLVSHQSPQRTESPSIPIRISLIWAPGTGRLFWSLRSAGPPQAPHPRPSPSDLQYVTFVTADVRIRCKIQKTDDLHPSEVAGQKWAQRYLCECNSTAWCYLVAWRMSSVRFNKHFCKHRVHRWKRWPMF